MVRPSNHEHILQLKKLNCHPLPNTDNLFTSINHSLSIFNQHIHIGSLTKTITVTTDK